MNAPSLQRLAVLSLLFHITLFAAGFWAANKQSDHFAAPSPYIVNLVGADVITQGNAAPAVEQSGEQVSTKETESVPPQKEVKKLTRKEELKLKERIAALGAKKKAMEIARIRNRMKDITPLKGSGTAGKGVLSARVKGEGEGPAVGSSMVDNYIAGVTNKIHNQWEIPKELEKEKLKATVSIRIMKNGSIQIIEPIEKPSGNSLFDRSVRKAIIKARPVTPPPYEMEIGVRFYQ